MVGRFINPDTGKPIHPDKGKPSELLRASIIISNPVRMKWRIATGERLPGHTTNDYGRGLVHEDFEENLTGLFGIDANFLDWDLNGKANGTFGRRTRACFYRGVITYMVSGPLTIDRDKLVVTEEDLTHYLEITGNHAELPEDNTNSKKTTLLHAPLMIQENPVIRLPRLDYYTPEELAEYWRDELGITNASDSRVWHYVHVGKLKTSLRYEYPDGRGWFFEEAPARTSMIDILNAPPVEKYYIRLQEAERFERAYFGAQVIEPLPEVALNIAATTSHFTPAGTQSEPRKAMAQTDQQFNFQNGIRRAKDRAPITRVIEAFYSAPYKPHNRANFYAYVKEQLANKQARIGEVLFSEFIEKVVTAERGKGVYMVKPKEGAKSSTEEDYRYSDAALSSLLSRKKGKKEIAK